MKNKYVFTAVLLAAILFVGSVLTMAYVGAEQKKEQAEDGDLLVVTSFYPMYVAAENVIGDVEGVTLENLSEPQTGCLHDYQLTAADMKLLSKADVFIVNGGGIESFLSDVAESYPNLKIVQACNGIDLLESTEGTQESLSDDSSSDTDADSEAYLSENEDAYVENDDHNEETDLHVDTNDHSDDTDIDVEADSHDEDADHDDHDHSEHSQIGRAHV